MKLSDLLVPVNPQFKWDADPTEQFDYVNPVTLYNKQISLANAALTVTQSHIQANTKIGTIKVALQEAQNALDDFEQDILRQFPPPPAQSKNLKLMESHVRTAAFQGGMADKLTELRNAVRKYEGELVTVKIDAENCMQMFQAIKLAGEHGQTHLSYVKDEAKRSGLYR